MVCQSLRGWVEIGEGSEEEEERRMGVCWGGAEKTEATARGAFTGLQLPASRRADILVRNPAGRFPVQFLIFVLSQKLAGAAFHGLTVAACHGVVKNPPAR
jgi:hypothetical protein